MQPIKRTSFRYKLAFCSYWGDSYTSRFSICQLWRKCLTGLVRWPATFCLSKFFDVFEFVMMFLFGQRLARESDKTHAYAVQIKCLPKICGKRLWPITVVGLIALIILMLSMDYGQLYRGVSEGIPYMVPIFGIITAFLILIMILFLVVGVMFLSFFVIETSIVYIKAKKEKICPIIEVVD